MPFNQIFPALELSQAKRDASEKTRLEVDKVIGSGIGLINVRLHAAQNHERIHLSVQMPGVTSPSEMVVTLPEKGVDYEIRPRLNWEIDKLHKLQSGYDETLIITLQRNDQIAEHRQIKVSMRPLNEALYYVRDGNETVDLSWIFAAYVNPRDDVVDKILEMARNVGVEEDFKGYANNDSNHLYRQVWAVWQAIESHGVRYSNADPAVSRGPRVFSQRVRFLFDTWQDKKANCIDGSALLASVLERLGIHTFIVLVPGHAFLGFYTDAAKQNAAYIETTLLGEGSLPPLQQHPLFALNIPLNANSRRSLTSFTAALAAGRARFSKIAKKLDGQYRPDYVVIDIATARNYGIMPISLRAPH